MVLRRLKVGIGKDTSCLAVMLQEFKISRGAAGNTLQTNASLQT